jgi:pimeloyl-ACP methyl ester carboxylesterase
MIRVPSFVSVPLRASARLGWTTSLIALSLAVGACGGAAGPHTSGAPDSQWSAADCPEHEVAPPVRCGTVPVFEDRAAGEGRTIDVAVVVLGSTGTDPAPDPLFILFGGPGQGAAEFALRSAEGFTDTRERRDVVFVDQRGTGASNPLDCPFPEDPSVVFEGVFPHELMESCRAELELRADLGLYTTAHFADDLDDVRAALGYERINLSGGSYGTRASLVFARRHPERVRSLILDGVFPPQVHAVLPYARTADESLRHVFTDCRADAACAAAYPDLEARFDDMMTGFTEPVQVNISTGGESEAVVSLSRGVFGYGLRGIQYGPRVWSLPKLLAAAGDGDFEAVAQAYYGRAAAIWDAVSVGQHLSVFCAEDLPFVDAAQIGPMTEETYLGRYLFDEYADACRLWVRGDVPPDVHEPVSTDAPVLMFSGRRDPITPPWMAADAGQTLPSNLHVVFETGGHGYRGGDDGGCRGRISDQFLELGSIEGVDTSCATEIEPAGFEVP